jgi:hypothetical protein
MFRICRVPRARRLMSPQSQVGLLGNRGLVPFSDQVRPNVTESVERIVLSSIRTASPSTASSPKPPRPQYCSLRSTNATTFSCDGAPARVDHVPMVEIGRASESSAGRRRSDDCRVSAVQAAHSVGAPKDLASATLRPVGPSVTLTATASASPPRSIASSARVSKRRKGSPHDIDDSLLERLAGSCSELMAVAAPLSPPTGSPPRAFRYTTARSVLHCSAARTQRRPFCSRKGLHSPTDST